MNNIKNERIIKALDYIYNQAFGVGLTWSQKQKIQSVKNGGIIKL